MTYSIFFFLNFFFYISLLFLLNQLFKRKYLFPFRLLDLINFFINCLLFIFISLYYFNQNILILIIFNNLNFFYIFFHIQNMVNTSPRTKILIDLYLNKPIYKYNSKIIVNNRVKRLLTTKQIIKKNNYIILNNQTKSLKLITLIFSLIKKF